jgi:RND family efflux transporter MFP subunit
MQYRFLFISILIASFYSCTSHNEEQLVANTDKPVSVKISEAVTSSSQGLGVSGKITSVQTAQVSTRVMGTITMLKVKEGDYVSQGQVLATISGSEMDAKRSQTSAMISEAEANLKNAAKDYERYKTLYEKQSASAKELEGMTLQYKSAQARVEAAKQMRNEVSAMMGYTTVTAPFSGVVVKKLAEAGTLANPGMPLLILEQAGQLEVEVAVPETNIAGVSVKDGATVEVKSTGKKFATSVVSIIPSSQFTGGQFIIKLAVPASEKSGLYSGMYVHVHLPEAGNSKTASSGVFVPVSAVFSKDQLNGIYVLGTNKRALLRWVRTGRQQGNLVEVLSGLSAGEKIIISYEGKLYNGAPVSF